MATRFFLRAAASDINPGTEDERLAALSAGASLAVSTTSTVAGPTAGVQCRNEADTNDITFLTNPLNAITISGTITFNLWANESSMNANTGMQVKVERTNGAGVVQSTIVNSEFGTELGFAGGRTAQNWTAAPTSTALTAGDRLKITMLGNDAGGTMVTALTFAVGFNGATGAADGDTWVEFTETITEAAGAGAPHFVRRAKEMSGGMISMGM